MVIDGLNNTSSANSANNNRARTAEQNSDNNRTSAESPAARSTEGQVSISAAATRLAELEQNIAASDEVDNDRVAALRGAIESGSFQINAERIAERFLEQDDLFA
ncbi:flagellar biosynthesis anti-sigma factor FlgM [Marinibactrum halimedae]|uniref:Negative regulator of flagellin synthesis n=1 Tax=Marinibactrum halimedae TaxID=1444977 RepID=A0AA37T6J7_9GAMM|nr:flagellar biosynthesis anti-sigma factor FlgM [Marinibactrum halimedae]MCD9461120.1 flagellar biosynthesis anti-sigma factor FlgM [Marinibactrum halimedae]GLS24460.1 hypothetical protein GCM10007877_01710 [Marinibactrum halimedae]